jgi:hypothetical protein
MCYFGRGPVKDASASFYGYTNEHPWRTAYFSSDFNMRCPTYVLSFIAFAPSSLSLPLKLRRTRFALSDYAWRSHVGARQGEAWWAVTLCDGGA